MAAAGSLVDNLGFNKIMVFFKERNLNIAILISALWHFLFIFSVKPVFSTGHIAERNTSIAFLGDILEKIIPENERSFLPDHSYLKNKINELEPNGPGFINMQPEKKEFLYSPSDRNSLNLNMPHKKEITRVNFSDFFIKGSAKDRVIIYKPNLDKSTVLPSDFNSDFSANIKFKISKDGFVEYAECVTSSGFPEMDNAAIRYVRKWQFVPAPDDNQEGMARINFKQ